MYINYYYTNWPMFTLYRLSYHFLAIFLLMILDTVRSYMPSHT